MYITISDVERELNDRWSDTTSPTVSDIEQFILEAENIINGILHNAGIVTPVKPSSAITLAIIRSGLLGYVVSHVMSAYSGLVSDTTEKEKEYLSRWEKTLDIITKYPNVCADAGRHKEVSYNNGKDHTFVMGENSW